VGVTDTGEDARADEGGRAQSRVEKSGRGKAVSGWRVIPAQERKGSKAGRKEVKDNKIALCSVTQTAGVGEDPHKFEGWTLFFFLLPTRPCLPCLSPATSA
jgi:hypothetical protein